MARRRRLWAERSKQKGVAMIMAVSALALMTYVAMEVMYDATVEYSVNAQNLNRLKAYYAARSGLEISLLRIKIYQTILQKFGDQTGPYQQYIDEIWRFPMAWPIPLPDEINAVDKENVQKITKESLIDTSFMAVIEDEGSKIDLNDLNSPSKKLAEITRKRLLETLQHQAQNDPAWQDQYGSYRFEDLVNNITDWLSSKRESLNGGDKRSGYEDLNKDRPFYPTNGMFRTLQELHLVKGMTDDFYEFLAPRLTIYGMRGVNPNVATIDVLKSLDPGITDEIAKEIITRRDDTAQGGPFKNGEDFWGFVQSKGARLITQNPEAIPLTFETLISFRIRSTGSFGNNTIREIDAIVTDLDASAQRLKALTDKEQDQGQGQGQGKGPVSPVAAKSQQVSTSKGPPRIVFWSER